MCENFTRARSLMKFKYFLFKQIRLNLMKLTKIAKLFG